MKANFHHHPFSSSNFEQEARRKTNGGFTLVELILVLALLVIAASIAAPSISKFVRGRALESEARRLASLMHAGQSRAVAEGAPMLLWLDEKGGSYGLQAETTGDQGDTKAETLNLDGTLQLTVPSVNGSSTATLNNFPAVKFLADGTVDETSPQNIRLQDSAGYVRELRLGKTRLGYEIAEGAK